MPEKNNDAEPVLPEDIAEEVFYDCITGPVEELKESDPNIDHEPGSPLIPRQLAFTAKLKSKAEKVMNLVRESVRNNDLSDQQSSSIIDLVEDPKDDDPKFLDAIDQIEGRPVGPTMAL